MGDIRAYILSVTAAAILCAIVNALSPAQGPGGAIVKLVTGILMAAVIIQPLGAGIAVNLEDRFRDLDRQVIAAVELGTELAGDELAARIKHQTESYILDKAAKLDADIQVQVTLSEEKLPVPASVIIQGSISPATRAALMDMITGELGIGEEDVKWS